jgi:RNA polymerase sigma factor (TIGR02999 family)
LQQRFPEALDWLIELYAAIDKMDEVKKDRELRAKYPKAAEKKWPSRLGGAMTPRDLLPLVYDELRKLAAAKLAAEQPGYTLNATALVHEAWLKLAGASVEWQDRTHFLRTAATAMRRILVDQARAKRTAKRDVGQRVELPDVAAPLPDEQLLALDEALVKFAEIKPDHARLVELRYFAGLTGDKAAEALGVSPPTADRMWRYARAWLQVEMQVIHPS